MTRAALHEHVRGWFTGRLPDGWFVEPPEVTIDNEEITVVGRLAEPASPDGASDAEKAAAVAGRVKGFREDTRDTRIRIAQEAEHAFDRKVSWGVIVGDSRHLFTTVSAPVMTRLRQPERAVLDTLVEAGVARSRSDALAWCVRLVGRHEGDWLAELREALTAVKRVRSEGPTVV